MSITQTSRFTGLLLALAVVLPGVAAAEMHLGAGVGALEPWRGDTGYSVVGQLMGSAFSDHVRLGVEFEYQSYETEILGLAGIDVNSYSLRGVAQFVLLPEKISPYLGIAYGFNLIEVDDDRVDAAFAASGVDVDAFGVGTGGLLFLGLQVPLAEHFALFAEGRAGIATELTDAFDHQVKSKNLSGYTGMAGVRLSF